MSQTAPEKTTTNSNPTLYLAMELSKATWKLAMSAGGQTIRTVAVPGGSIPAVLKAVALAKTKLGLAANARVLSCYEAGRDGFWIHRMLVEAGVENLVVDPASIEVDRRARRAKTDRLDAKKLLSQLVRHDELGDRLHVVRVPSHEEEDERRLGRELERLRKERTAHLARIRSLLALHGISTLPRKDGLDRERLRTADGRPFPARLVAELRREFDRLDLVRAQIRVVEQTRAAAVSGRSTKANEIAAALMALKGIGPNAATLFAAEFFSWRKFQNGKQVGACAGLTGTPYDSGGSAREQGISKAGNRRVRAMAIEIAWQWLRYQPVSLLARWYRERFGASGSRSRRIGIVALARKLLVALWRYTDQGIVPEGALMKP